MAKHRPGRGYLYRSAVFGARDSAIFDTHVSLQLIKRADALSRREASQLLQLLADAVARSGLAAPQQADFLAESLREQSRAMTKPRSHAQWLLAPRRGAPKNELRNALRRQLHAVACFLLNERMAFDDDHAELAKLAEKVRSKPLTALTRYAEGCLETQEFHDSVMQNNESNIRPIEPPAKPPTKLRITPKDKKLAEEVATEVVNDLRETGTLPPRTSRKSRAN